MNDRQIKSFLSVVKEGSFSKAASKNYLSVASLIEQIDRLEDDLNFKLFIRTNKGVSLTKEGEIFYKTVLKLKDEYLKGLKAIYDLNNKTINVGIASGQYPSLLEDICTKYAKNKKFSLSLIELPYSDHIEALLNNKIDITLIAKPKAKYLNKLDYIEIAKDTYSFAMNINNKLSLKESITINDLKNTTILCATYDYLEVPFNKGLYKSKARLNIINSEYDLQSRFKAKINDEVLVFHHLWENCYKDSFKVIGSNIDAGSVGLLFRKNDRNRLNDFINFFKD